MRARLIVVSAQARSPIATVAARPRSADDPLEDRSPVVGLVDDDDLPLDVLLQVERRDHAREHVGRLLVGAEERARHPAVRVRALAEERDSAPDAGQVFEVGREAEEEQVDVLRAHPLREPRTTLRVVEHRPSLRSGFVERDGSVSSSAGAG